MKRLLTKPIWWWERQRSYPIRSQFNRLPPISVRPARRQFVVLTTPKALSDALWTAWSWYRYLQGEQFELHVAVDGELPKAEEQAVRELFPGIQIDNIESVIAALRASSPVFGLLFDEHPLGKKLGLILAMSQQNAILYADHDVLAFNPPDELLTYVGRDTPCYMLEENESNWDSVIVEHAKSLEMECLSRFNSGFLYVPKDALSFDLAAQILSTWQPPATSWYTEQTVLGILMRRANAAPLSRDRYVVSNRRQFYWEKDVDYKAIAARHFTGTVRHVMYRYGMPAVLRQSKVSPIMEFDTVN
jgi:hypothetical protein